jgi:PHD/YefM family antitoxin component YafN of YafNO toxin-antitoxin module
MREIQASQAKTHLPQLLDEVERGETVIITRHGRPELIDKNAQLQLKVIELRERIKELEKPGQGGANIVQ